MHGLDQLIAVVCSLGKGIEFAVGIAVVQQSARRCVHWAALCCMWAARRSATKYVALGE